MFDLRSLSKKHNNPRTISKKEMDKLKKSVTKFSKMLPLRPIVYDPKTMEVLGGNQRLIALLETGSTLVPDEWVRSAEGMTEKEKQIFVIADNANFGENDLELIKSDYMHLNLEDFGLDIDFDLGTDDDDYDDTEQSDNSITANEDYFEVPEDVEFVITEIKEGDLFEITNGNGIIHRLICGDSTDPNVVEILCDKSPDMVFSDPPYGINWNTDYTRFSGGLRPSTSNYDKIHDDEKDFDPSYWIENYKKCFLFGANCFSDRLPKGNWIVWDKRFENDKAFLADAEVAWYNGSGAIYIIKETHQGFVSSDKKRFHPTQKPIKLLEKCFEKINAPHFLFDPFGGSGSTMVTSHQTGRKCYMIEMLPKYCQVILDRMAALDDNIRITKINEI